MTAESKPEKKIDEDADPVASLALAGGRCEPIQAQALLDGRRSTLQSQHHAIKRAPAKLPNAPPCLQAPGTTVPPGTLNLQHPPLEAPI